MGGCRFGGTGCIRLGRLHRGAVSRTGWAWADQSQGGFGVLGMGASCRARYSSAVMTLPSSSSTISTGR
ncbi:MAG: hypothetical protein D1H97_17055 [Paracoccus sp. BP8]|nr:MAG: hypothetical protein D1H97_17055 [Paracoccus sp. BP8]